MRLALLLSLLATCVWGGTGFMCAVSRAISGTSKDGGSRKAAAVRAPSAFHLCEGRSRTATRSATRRVCTTMPGVLRMKTEVEEGGVAADGGSADGSALAEARIVVHGQSTGGYFRAQARNEAHFNRKLCGALKELGKGRTEIIVEGKTSSIRGFLRWCKRGPGLTQQIEEVTVDWSEYTGIFDGFEVFPDESS